MEGNLAEQQLEFPANSNISGRKSVKVWGLLSWYDESPSWLAEAVASFAPVLDGLIAVDGAYALYPDARASSERVQAETIMATANALGLPVTLHRPAEPWQDGEVGKRDAMMRMANAHATSHRDWLWVFDADCVLTEYPDDLRDRLAGIDGDAVEVRLWERHDYQADAPEVARTMSLPSASTAPMRMLFRCLDRMQVIGAHYIYAGVTEDGDYRYLWGPPHVAPVDGVEFTDVMVEHRSTWRDLYRREAARDYYKRREVAGIERLTTDDGSGTLMVEAHR